MSIRRAALTVAGKLMVLALPIAAQQSAVQPDSAQDQIRTVLRAFYFHRAHENWEALASYVLSPKLLERRTAPGDLRTDPEPGPAPADRRARLLSRWRVHRAQRPRSTRRQFGLTEIGRRCPFHGAASPRLGRMSSDCSTSRSAGGSSTRTCLKSRRTSRPIGRDLRSQSNTASLLRPRFEPSL
jgi:hypothetical protein